MGTGKYHCRESGTMVKNHFKDENVAEFMAIRWSDWLVDMITRNCTLAGVVICVLRAAPVHVRQGRR